MSLVYLALVLLSKIEGMSALVLASMLDINQIVVKLLEYPQVASTINKEYNGLTGIEPVSPGLMSQYCNTWDTNAGLIHQVKNYYPK